MKLMKTKYLTNTKKNFILSYIKNVYSFLKQYKSNIYVENLISLSEVEKDLFTTLKQIINNDLIHISNKQRRIEKLMNVYYLKKEENKFNLNPF